jgi:enterochelin esterase-like enzyme
MKEAAASLLRYDWLLVTVRVPLPRRTFLLGLAAASANAAIPLPSRSALAAQAPSAPLDLDVRDITVEGDSALGRRFVLLVPKHLAKGERVPLLVLLHGLGETGDERMGAYAWLERYGLGTAYDRLRRPPIKRTSKRADWSDARVSEINALLASRPFKGMAIACPYTPNVAKSPRGPTAALDAYARWIAEVVLPRARQEAPVIPDAAHTAIDGCSLGGYVGLEVFLRKPDLFSAVGGVQAAFGTHRAAGYADRIAAATPRPTRIHLETSSADPFREANALLSSLLHKKGVANDLLILPGPHDQPWLRESGTLEMLLWHDRIR